MVSYRHKEETNNFLNYKREAKAMVDPNISES